MKNTGGEKYLIVTSIIFGFFGLFARYLSDKVDIALTVVIINIIQFFFFGVICIKNKDFKINQSEIILFIIFSVVNAFPLLFFNEAISRLSIGGVLLLQNTATIVCSVIIDTLFLNRKLNLFQMGLIIISLLGLVVIYLPFELINWFGLIFAIGVGITNALANLFRSKLSINNTSSKMIFYSSFLSILIWSIYLVFKSVDLNIVGNLNLIIWLVLLLYGVMNILTSYLLIKGFSKSDLTVGNLILMLEIVFGFIIGFIFIGEGFGSYQLAGNLIVLISIILIRVSEDFQISNKHLYY